VPVVWGPGTANNSFCGGTAAKIFPKPPSSIGMTMTAAKAVDVDQNVLDDRDRCRSAQTARIGEGREHREGNDERQVGGQARSGDAQCADHDLDAHQLQAM